MGTARRVALGAGEILLTSVDKEGFERAWTARSSSVNCARRQRARHRSRGAAARRTPQPRQWVWASARAVASILHYKKTTVPQLKAGIREHGIEVR